MAAVRFRLDHPKKDDPKPVSVMVQLYISSKIRPELATGEKVSPDHWDSENQRATAKHSGYKKLNLHLSTITADLMQLWRENKHLEARALREKMAQVIKGAAYNSQQKKTLFEVMTRFIEAYKGEKAANSYKMYVTLERRLKEFDNIYPIDIDTLDFTFYDRFKAFLYNLPNKNYNGYSLHQKDGFYLIQQDRLGAPVGIFDDKVFKYFINLRTVLSWAEKRGHKVHQSYKQWEIIRRKYDPISLTMEELERLESADLPKNLAIARDYLVLECRTGQRISDIKRFDLKDVAGMKWTNTPKKGNRISGKKVTIHFTGFCEPAWWILQRYKFKMPTISEVTLNKRIKDVCRIARINTPIYIERWAGSKKIRFEGAKYHFISTHTGRKTFITLACQFMPDSLVMELAGIDEYDTLKHYKGKAEDHRIEKYLNEMSETSPLRKAQ